MMPSKTKRGSESDQVVSKTEDAAVRALRDQNALTRAALSGALENGPSPDQAAQAPSAISENVAPGAVYGKFVREVGLAVAEAQAALDDNSVKQASILSEKEVKVLLAVVQEVDEDGRVSKVEADIKPLPLITQIQPAFYEFSKVTMFARFDVSEIASDGNITVKSSSSVSSSTKSGNFSGSLSGGFKFGKNKGGNIAGGIGGGKSNSNASSTASTGTDINSSSNVTSTSGSSYMEAILEPRRDSSFFEPIVVTNGPGLSVSASPGSIAKPKDSATGPATATVTVTLLKADQKTPLEGKLVNVNLSGPGLLSSTSVNTDSKGQGTVALTVRDFDSIGTATVTASLGVLKASVSVAVE